MIGKNAKDNNDLEITVDVESQNEGNLTDSIGDYSEEPKSLFMSLRDEFAERSAEDKELDRAVYEEKKRLEAEREAAKKKNIFRKIKFVDSKISQEELERDKEAEQSKLNAARAERSDALVKENKKPIAIAVLALVLICVVVGFIVTQKHKATIANNYNKAVECIMTEQYSDAFDVLEKMNYKDSQALCDYAELQMLIEGYKGEPDQALADLKAIEGIEHESVNAQYHTACGEVQKATDIQADIDAIDISSVDTISEKVLGSIEESEKSLATRYEVLLDTEKYDIASRVIFNRNNNTEAWKLITALTELGDITLESKDTLDSLRKTYDGLSEEDKNSILNYSILTSAESKYAELKKADDERVAAEKEKAEAEKKKAEEKAKRDNPPKMYNGDFTKSDTESYDYGYVEIRARASYNVFHNLWDFSTLDKDGSTLGGEYIRDVGIDESKIPDAYKEMFKQCIEDRPNEDYVFTLRGDASWKPMREGSSGANTGFKFYLDKVVKIEYDPE